MSRKKIHNWKSIALGYTLQDAIQYAKDHCYDDNKFAHIGIGLNNKEVLDVLDLNDRDTTFTLNQIINNKWNIYVPDDDKEQILYKCREIVKNENLLSISNKKIDELDMDQLWLYIQRCITSKSDKTKYRVIKCILENKLYKES